MYKADLHIHSTLSDGEFSPLEILQMAKKIGLTHLCFTEHDTTMQSQDRVKQGKAMGICVIPGIEISAFHLDAYKKVHLLGYGYGSNRSIEKLCAATVKNRNESCEKQMVILQELGYEINRDLIREKAQGFLYKQFILDYLVKTGQTDAIFGDIYHFIFKNGGPCDFDIEYVDPIEAVKAIKTDGGYAVLAHPGQQDNLFFVKDLVQAGLDGIELNHYANNEQTKTQIRQLCKEYGLFTTGGSDFHGSYSKNNMLPGDFQVEKNSKILTKWTQSNCNQK